MKKNTAIECDVKECKYNCVDTNYCSLNSIKVGTHESHPTKCQCVDCMSFKAK